MNKITKRSYEEFFFVDFYENFIYSAEGYFYSYEDIIFVRTKIFQAHENLFFCSDIFANINSSSRFYFWLNERIDNN